MPPEASASDEELLDRARRGDQRAFQLLVERYEGQVAATVISMVGRGADADDIGQETFIRFYRSMHAFRGEASLGTYLTRIAINQSLKALKRRQKWTQRFFSRDESDADLGEPIVEGDRPIADRERNQIVHQAIQRLGPDHRAVVALRMLEGYSTRETAEMLGIPEGTVMSRLSRAMKLLGQLLGPILNEDD